MSAREFKPGDVAMVAHKTGEHRAIRVPDSWSLSTGWADCLTDDLVSEARPLVVIDPEDDGACERLLRTLDRWGYEFRRTPEFFDPGRDHWYFAAALREFANSTEAKPDEPLGLGAVVVDREDSTWVRYSDESGSFWTSRHGATLPYRLIDVVRVLSEGVTE